MSVSEEEEEEEQVCVEGWAGGRAVSVEGWAGGVGETLTHTHARTPPPTRQYALNGRHAQTLRHILPRPTLLHQGPRHPRRPHHTGRPPPHTYHTAVIRTLDQASSNHCIVMFA